MPRSDICDSQQFRPTPEVIPGGSVELGMMPLKMGVVVDLASSLEGSDFPKDPIFSPGFKGSTPGHILVGDTGFNQSLLPGTVSLDGGFVQGSHAVARFAGTQEKAKSVGLTQ